MRFCNSAIPAIAAVHGACIANAFHIARSCDITAADDDAVFHELERKFGACVVLMLLPWMTGPKQAKNIIFTGADVSRHGNKKSDQSNLRIAENAVVCKKRAWY